MTVTEKAAYLRGLAEGLNLEADAPQTKLFNAIIDLLDDLTLTVADLEDGVEILNEQVDAVDEDLDELESFVYEEYDDEYDDDDEDEFFEVECPSCNEIVCVDEGILEEGSINCPNCNELLEFEIDCDCEECQDEED